MSVRIIILLFLALGTAGGTAMLAQNWLISERAELMASVPKQVVKKEKHGEILVAKNDMLTGSFVLKESLIWQEWPENAIGERMLKKGDVEIEDFVGSVIRTRIPAGQPVLPSAMVRSGEQGFMAAVLAPGMRAVTVPLSATSGVGGFIFPGDQVDLLLTIKLKPKDENPILDRDWNFTETLLKDVRVIGKDQSALQTEGEAKIAKSATLEVTLKQAEQVALAIQIGKLSLSLRSLADEDSILLGKLNTLPEKIDPLNHRISMNEEQTSGMERLEIEDDMSLTTDADLNFFWHKMKHLQPQAARVQTSRKVQVLRGSDAKTREFN